MAQALPATYQQIATLASALPSFDAAALLLAWKTASLWEDILTLRRDNFVLLSHATIVIQWGISGGHHASNMTRKVAKGHCRERSHEERSAPTAAPGPRGPTPVARKTVFPDLVHRQDSEIH